MSDAPAWSDRLAAHWPATAGRRALAAGLVFAGPATLVAFAIAGGYVGLTSPGEVLAFEPGVIAVAIGLPVAAGLAAALAGAPLWWLIVERPAEATTLRGGLVGAVVGIVAHPLMWLLFGAGGGAAVLFVGGVHALLDVVGGGAASLLGMFVLFTVVGLLLTGIVTVSVAAGTGVALAHLRRKAPGTGRGGADRDPTRRRPQDL